MLKCICRPRFLPKRLIFENPEINAIMDAKYTILYAPAWENDGKQDSYRRKYEKQQTIMVVVRRYVIEIISDIMS